MILGAMQPYFFPYIGYYDLINRCDQWIVFDVVQYKSKSWMNRNRILHPAAGWQYITVPVHKHTGEGRISDTLIADKQAAKERILGQVEHYRKAGAPFFKATREIILESFDCVNSDKLRDLNLATLKVVCAYVGIPFNYTVLSEAHVRLPSIEHAGQWALELCTAFGANHYINPPNGRSIFRREEFQARGITLGFTTLEDFRYDCKPYAFVEHLSILDVLMWNSPQAIKQYLDSCR